MLRVCETRTGSLLPAQTMWVQLLREQRADVAALPHPETIFRKMVFKGI